MTWLRTVALEADLPEPYLPTRRRLLQSMPATYISHCIGCPYERAEHLAPAERAVRATPLSLEDNGGQVLLIFQAPGIGEWERGRPVSSTAPGSVGARLETAFVDSGRSRTNYDITNSVQCFPGKKEMINGKRPRDKRPSAAARRQCANWLRQDITARRYKRVIVFGSIAKEVVRSLAGIDMTSFTFCRHPSGGLSDAKLLEVVG